MIGVQMLKATEAAAVSCVSLRDVHRVIDERILPETLVSRDNRRLVRASACTFIAFYFESAKRLTSEERMFAIRSLASRLHAEGWRQVDWTVRHEFLTIDLASFADRSAKRLARLEMARDLVVASDDTLGGTPVIRGTRIPVYDVASLVVSGRPMDEVLDDYPSLTRDQVDLAVLYAQANPIRGRPRPLSSRLTKPIRVLSERRVARQRAE